jgi:hypothetical protein
MTPSYEARITNDSTYTASGVVSKRMNIAPTEMIRDRSQGRGVERLLAKSIEVSLRQTRIRVNRHELFLSIRATESTVKEEGGGLRLNCSDRSRSD